jgi:signal transduction histidine kinase
VRSIRLRLTAWMLVCVAVVAVAAAWGVYRSALVDVDELFDYQLRQLALSLRDQGVVSPFADPDDSVEIVVQIWDDSGTRLYLSHPRLDLPQRAIIGFANIRIDGADWRVYSVRLSRRTIQVAQPMSVRLALARSHAFRTLLPVVVLLPLLALALWIAAQHALRPMSTLARDVRARDPALLAPIPEAWLPEELLPLVRALNDLLRRLAAALEAQRAFVADAAHELRSPLTALKLQAQLYDRSTDPVERSKASAQLAAGIDRASHLVEQLLMLARSDPAAAETPRAQVRLDEASRLAIADVVALAASRGVDLGLSAPEAVPLRGDFDALRVFVRNLVDNAVRYTPRSGHVEVLVARRGHDVVVEVSDTGPGIPPAERERVFARFHRSGMQQEPGTGLGLAIAKAIVERHLGRIELVDAPGGGLLARAIFPLPPP